MPKANNPLCAGYDPSKPTTWLIYLDVNNPYGWSMLQPLPTGGFDLCNPSLDEVLATPDDAPEGYLLEIDVEYLKELHDTHSDYPLAPETMVIPESSLSYYAQTLENEMGGKFTKSEKLVPNLHVHNKERYVLHYRNLKLYHSLCMRVTKIHRALKFQQSAWMKPYIKKNTALRADAK